MKPSNRAHSLLTLLRTTALRLLWQWSQWRRASRAPALIPIRIDSVRRERPGAVAASRADAATLASHAPAAPGAGPVIATTNTPLRNNHA